MINYYLQLTPYLIHKFYNIPCFKPNRIFHVLNKIESSGNRVLNLIIVQLRRLMENESLD